MTLLELAKWLGVGLGKLLVADAVARFGLGFLEQFQLAELALGVLLLVVSRSVLPLRSLVAVVMAWSALFGLMRLAYWLLSGVAYGTPHPFDAIGYAWRSALFVAIGSGFLYITRRRAARAA